MILFSKDGYCVITEGIVFRIKRYALHDGPGIRTTVFLKGCPLACPWCHNPEGQRAEIETMQAGGSQKEDGSGEQETVGWRTSVDDLLAEIEKDRIFFDTSGGGVTFSGGEPLMQVSFLTALLAGCRRWGIHTVVDTSGYASPDELQQAAAHTDLFLFDLKIVDPQAHLRLTGCDNQPILDNLAWLDRAGKAVIVRFALVPGMTDDTRNIDAIADLMSASTSLRRVDILPFHRIAAGKYRRLQHTNPFSEIEPPDLEAIDKVRKRFENHGLDVHIGG